MEKKPDELLDRLKTVKVSSTDGIPDDKNENRPLPVLRMHQEIPTFGYEEPKSIPEGRFTLRQALEFLTNHQNDPAKHSTASIAESYKLKSTDVENVMKHFRAFELYISSDKKVNIARSSMKALGANKVVEPLYSSKFLDMEKEKEDKTDPPK